MDIPEEKNEELDDFFAETSFPLRLPVPPSEIGESVCSNQNFAFNFGEPEIIFEESNQIQNKRQINLQTFCEQYINDIDETNPLDHLINDFNPYKKDNSFKDSNRLLQKSQFRIKQQQLSSTDHPNEVELEQIINYLIKNSRLSKSQLKQQITKHFPRCSQNEIVQMLVDKFSNVKKTREQLIKYCMRKAFKFILELPKNMSILKSDKEQKFSFAKSKQRFLKKVSEERSMNHTFLTQIFNEGDFAQDYNIFLEAFQAIIIQDNAKKVKLLATNLSQEGYNKKSGDITKRLPWTDFILNRVRTISKQLLKFEKLR